MLIQPKYIFSSLLIILSISIVACGSKDDKAGQKPGGNRPNLVQAEGFVVNGEVYKNNFTASGSLVPNEEVSIIAEINGKVTDIFFKEGMDVKKGQVLVQLYDADLKAQVQKLQAQRDLQRKTLERQKELLGIGGISKQDYETTETQIASINADIAYAQAQLQRTKIAAPFAGRIGIRNISPGAVISPTTVVATLQQLHPLKMDFTIPDIYRNNIAAGKEVSFSVDGMLDTMTGTISAIDPGADPATRNVKVRAMIPNSNHKLLAGSFAHVMISLETDEHAILIPSQSVIPTTRDKKVAVVRNGKADLVTVQLGERTTDKVQVLKGLQSGDTILTTGLMQVKQDMSVKITRLKG